VNDIVFSNVACYIIKICYQYILLIENFWKYSNFHDIGYRCDFIKNMNRRKMYMYGYCEFDDMSMARLKDFRKDGRSYYYPSAQVLYIGIRSLFPRLLTRTKNYFRFEISD